LKAIVHRIVVISSFGLAAGAANACSVCIAHAFGAALHAIGAQVMPQGKIVVGVSFVGFDKSNGADGGGTEHERFRQISLDAQYGLNEQTMLTASIPYVFKSIKADGEDRQNASGLGDITLGATYQFKPKESDFAILAVDGSVKLPTGQDNARDSNGVLKEQHVQLGTGSTDFGIGITATRDLGMSRMGFLGLHQRFNGSNSRGYRYGNTFFYNVGYSAPLNDLASYVVEWNGRISNKDRTETGEMDPESGGHLGYLSLSLRYRLGTDYGLILGYQLPVFEHLNGSQHEGGLISFSISRMF